MTGGVLVEESVIEKMSAGGDWGTGRDECNFAKAGRTFVRVHQFLEDRFILLCADFYDLAILKREAEIFDQAAPVTQGERRVDRSIGAMAIGQGENFLGWHIGGEDHAILCQRLSADPFMSARQAESEICLIGLVPEGGCAIMERRIFFRL